MKTATAALALVISTQCSAFAPSVVRSGAVVPRVAPVRSQVEPAVPEDDLVESFDVLMEQEPDNLLEGLGDGEGDAAAASDEFTAPRPFLNLQALLAAQQKWKRHDSDSGSPEYQIAVAHERIKYLTAHLQRNPKDFASRRGLVAIVNKRRRLLNYLYRKNPEKAMGMVTELGVRFKPPGTVQTREEKYAVYNARARSKK
eukprot:CAMPEP_0118984966 /NCGR_PEP_ID=MMETSP1173-20130426/38858_1 /TAXON_ID=1034831 /ORGANISM="Rhizochromulina marina cf, Strain CCMP1243" /LENGTH=199 /DNA_ID=CAMNT_0006935657 /DNA_START=62 /DNA_END=661 /DNA_ORIENTATION=-